METNYPLSELATLICTPIVVGVLAIALPLLIEIINKIDEKYSSSIIVQLFNKSWQNKLFKRTLIVSIIFIFLYGIYLSHAFLFHYHIHKSIGNILAALITLFVILMLIFLFAFIRLQDKYDDAYCLTDILSDKLKKKQNKNNYIKSLGELLCYSIKIPNENLSRKLLGAFHASFNYYRKENKSIEFPAECYDSVLNINELICLKESRASSVLNGAVVLSMLLPDDENVRISPKTYECIWRCMRQCLFYPNNQNIVKSYWIEAHQYFEFRLNKLGEKYSPNFQITNTDEILERDADRDQFKEFHYLLGALVLYSLQTELLKDMMSCTNCQPPKYYLVPDSFDELFASYLSLKDNEEYTYYESKYNFPDVTGIDANDTILMWVQRYFAILFIRQYGIAEPYSNKPYHIELPKLPTTLRDLKRLEDKIKILQENVSYYIDEKTTLDELGLSHLYTDKELKKKGQGHPIDILNKYLEDINKQYDNIKEKQTISPSKRDEFNRKSMDMLIDQLSYITKLTCSKKIETKNATELITIGDTQQLILNKGIFDEHQASSYMDPIEGPAQHLCDKIKNDFSHSWQAFANTTYSVSYGGIATMIDKLDINADFVIMSTGIVFQQMWCGQIDGLIDTDGKLSYKGIDVVELGLTKMDSLNHSLFIIRKDQLPYLEKHELSHDMIEKYGYKLIDKENKIYTSVIDLNKNASMRAEISETDKDDNLKEKVLACVGVNYQLTWQKTAKYIQIKEK